MFLLFSILLLRLFCSIANRTLHPYCNTVALRESQQDTDETNAATVMQSLLFNLDKLILSF